MGMCDQRQASGASPAGKRYGSNRSGAWVGPRTCLDGSGKSRWTNQPVAGRFNECAKAGIQPHGTHSSPAAHWKIKCISRAYCTSHRLANTHIHSPLATLQNCWSSHSKALHNNVTIWRWSLRRPVRFLWPPVKVFYTRQRHQTGTQCESLLFTKKKTLGSAVFLKHHDSRGGQTGHSLYQPANKLNKTRWKTNHKIQLITRIKLLNI